MKVLKKITFNRILLFIIIGLFLTALVLHVLNNRDIVDRRNRDPHDYMTELDVDKHYTNVIVNSEGNYVFANFNHGNDTDSISMLEIDKDFEVKSEINVNLGVDIESGRDNIRYVQELSNNNYIIFTDRYKTIISQEGDILSQEYLTDYAYKSGQKTLKFKGFLVFILDHGDIDVQIYDLNGTLLDKNNFEVSEYINTLGIYYGSELFLSDGSFFIPNYSSLTKFDLLGNRVWEKQYDMYSNDIVETRDGNIVMVGYSYDYYENANSRKDDPTRFKKGTIIKVDSVTGGIMWSHSYGGKEDQLSFNSVEEVNDELIISGYGPNDSRGNDYFTVFKFTGDGNQIGTVTYELNKKSQRHGLYTPNLVVNDDQMIIHNTSHWYNKTGFIIPVEHSDFNKQINFTYEGTLTDKKVRIIYIGVALLFFYILKLMVTGSDKWSISVPKKNKS